MARCCDAKLTVLHVHGHPPAPPEAVVPAERLVWSSDLDAEAEQALEELKRTKLANVEWITLATLEETDTARAICSYAKQHGADLIVIGAHERSGVAYALLRSVAEKVLHHAPCAVFVVPDLPARESVLEGSTNSTEHQPF